MKTKIGTNSFAELKEHKVARARKLDRNEHIPSEKRITFATANEMLSHITPKRVRLCEVAGRNLVPSQNWRRCFSATGKRYIAMSKLYIQYGCCSCERNRTQVTAKCS